ncbi:HpcH/HpaI aldolase/citrate lyase family protein [Pandoraea sp. ISTKB]|uniref:HpcH/HpaI aldolase family protein n=1 Tax=Pandoraea sp. ISTKB TaxID=1586708 RepID=UPI000ACC1DDE|nr:aldolase/citrate lyase family protein [Pandoraea sp. ISTKB]
MFRKNLLKQSLTQGRKTFGAWLFLPGADTAEILGTAGFDALIVDHEHTAGDVQTTIAQLRAIRSAGDATVLARVPSCDAPIIKPLLDAGVEGLLLPTIESASEARRLASAAWYPPHGARGAHYTVSRAAGWGTDTSPYRANARRELLLIGMIESARGVAALPEILDENVLDMIFIGPLDLAESHGFGPAMSHRVVQAAITEVEQQVLARGVLLGGALRPGETPAQAYARGYSFVTVGCDSAFLRQTAEAGAQMAKLAADTVHQPKPASDSARTQ